MKQKWYRIINVAVIGLGVIFVLMGISTMAAQLSTWEITMLIELFAVIVLILGTQIIKGIRFYIILFEENISLKRFTQLFIKTTFVNIAIPFKLGELFRVFCFSMENKSVRIGLFSVLVDRFYDTLALIGIILLLTISSGNDMNGIFIFLLIFLMFVTLSYIIFPSIYQYFNHILIYNYKSKRSLSLLKLLEFLNESYQFTVRLVRARSMLLLIISILCWTLDYISIGILSNLILKSGNTLDLVSYINSTFTNINDSISSIYMIISSMILGLGMLIVYGKKEFMKG